MDLSANSTWDESWLFHLWCLCANLRWHWRWSIVKPGHRYGCSWQYPAASKHPWTMRTTTGHPVGLISFSPIKFIMYEYIYIYIFKKVGSVVGEHNTIGTVNGVIPGVWSVASGFTMPCGLGISPVQLRSLDIWVAAPCTTSGPLSA